jgi:cell division protein FtsW
VARAAALTSYGPPAGARGRSLLGTGWEAPMLLALTILLLSIGLVSVYSTSAFLAQLQGRPDYVLVAKQAVGAAGGLFLLVAMANVDYRRIRLLSWPLVLGLALVLLVLIIPGTQGIAPVRNGARRWLHIGALVIQPSEFAKLILISWTAALAVKKQDSLKSLSRGLLPFVTIWLLIGGLIALEPSFSAAMLVTLLSALVLFAAGARIGHLLVIGIIGLPLLVHQVGGIGYRLRRIITFVDPSADIAGMGYQINQALIALGSGGIFGRGFGRGQQKFGFLPEPHNDFIIAMIGEEWGFLGVLLIILLFGVFALIGYRIARSAPDLFGFLLAVGLTNLIVVQAFLHMAVNFALIPTTGVTLPFLSYGRSSLLVCLASVGILMNIARQAERRME